MVLRKLVFHANAKPTNMEKQIASIPGYRVYEYLLVIPPPEAICNRVQAIQKEFAGKYKAPMALGSCPHLALVKFYAYQMTQERIANRLQLTAMALAPFKVELKDYGSVPAHTIYINVATRLPLQQVVRQIKQAQSLLTLNKEHKPHFIEEPHLPICRKLKPWQYEQGWLEYSHRHFTGKFIADSMLLLKRPAGEKPYQTIMKFQFQNMPVQTKQGNLFL